MSDPILAVVPLGFPWQTLDPFLFCVHHKDAYPQGDDRFAPRASLSGRQIGNDFSYKDGWSMYHGEIVPGFPQHPHRGFETITVARAGFIDHSDSLGAAARFGKGDVQWMTAGAGVVHSEMFPLLNKDSDNPLELFQIWLNLPAKSKMAAPYFSMYWDHLVPKLELKDSAGHSIRLAAYAGPLDGKAITPPPDSWAAAAEADVRILTIRLDAGAQFEIEKAGPGVNRVLYFFGGRSVSISGTVVKEKHAIQLNAEMNATIVAIDGPCELLMLQGRPIGEPVAQYGPFVMNTQEEIQNAFADYRRTQFGGWPWPDDAPVHPRDAGKFARHADGRVEKPLDAMAASADL